MAKVETATPVNASGLLPEACGGEKHYNMANINYEGKSYELDGDGFMLKPEEWTEGLAAEIAKVDGINELTENHWKILHCIRENYEEKPQANQCVEKYQCHFGPQLQYLAGTESVGKRFRFTPTTG